MIDVKITFMPPPFVRIVQERVSAGATEIEGVVAWAFEPACVLQSDVSEPSPLPFLFRLPLSFVALLTPRRLALQRQPRCIFSRAPKPITCVFLYPPFSAADIEGVVAWAFEPACVLQSDVSSGARGARAAIPPGR